MIIDLEVEYRKQKRREFFTALLVAAAVIEGLYCFCLMVL